MEPRRRAGWRRSLLWVGVFMLLRLLLFTNAPVRDSWLELCDRPLQLDWRIRDEWGRSLCSASTPSGSKRAA